MFGQLHGATATNEIYEMEEQYKLILCVCVCVLGALTAGQYCFSHLHHTHQLRGICPNCLPACPLSFQCSFLPKFSIHIETKYEDNKGSNDHVSSPSLLVAALFLKFILFIYLFIYCDFCNWRK